MLQKHQALHQHDRSKRIDLSGILNRNRSNRHHRKDLTLAFAVVPEREQPTRALTCQPFINQNKLSGFKKSLRV
jgi:hypothetical protein